MKKLLIFLFVILSVFCIAALANAVPINVALNKTVTLYGAPFFQGGWGGGQTVGPETIVDGIFLPRGHQWDQGAVWWDAHDEEARWMTIDLGGAFHIESLIVQADDNDAYSLYYWDLKSNTWNLAWNVPNYDIVPDPSNWGMQTRPNPNDDTARYYLSTPIVTSALKFEGDMLNSDDFFSVSEIQAYGTPAPIPEPATALLIGTGLVGLLGFRKKFKK